MADQYIILSKKHMKGNQPVFWKDNDAGYTIYPFAAGVYDRKDVEAKPWYYNDGHNAIAIPLTESNLNAIGFKCSVNLLKLNAKRKEAQL